MDPTPPTMPHIISGYNLSGSSLNFTVLKRALSREENTRWDNEAENLGSRKSKIFHGILRYDQFFHGKLGWNTLLVGPLVRVFFNSCYFVRSSKIWNAIFLFSNFQSNLPNRYNKRYSFMPNKRPLPPLINFWKFCQPIPPDHIWTQAYWFGKNSVSVTVKYSKVYYQ